MVKALRIYCEGGGDSPKTKFPLHSGMSSFLKPLIEVARGRHIKFDLILCGGRKAAYDSFSAGLHLYPHAFNVLLVDAEAPVAKSNTPWRHLKVRDGWNALACSDEQCFLMVQAMEAWLIADLEALRKFYGQGFNANSIPKNPQVELIAKDALEPALIKASIKTQKGEYQKIRHGAKLLALIDSNKVRQASPHCDRLFTTLEKQLTTAG